jgi:hypothetical protein
MQDFAEGVWGRGSAGDRVLGIKFSTRIETMKVAIPIRLVNEILGNARIEETRSLGVLTVETTCTDDFFSWQFQEELASGTLTQGELVKMYQEWRIVCMLEVEEVGQLFQWAWQDVAAIQENPEDKFGLEMVTQKTGLGRLLEWTSAFRAPAMEMQVTLKRSEKVFILE